MYPSNLDVPGTAYDVDAAFMLFQQHESGIHVVAGPGTSRLLGYIRACGEEG